MIVFKKIILQNCFAYSYLEFDFNSGIHSIGGVNGASKTSIYLALAQGLFNRNPKGTKIDDVSNTVTKQPYVITVVFTKGKQEYTVVNSRKTGTISVHVDGKNISRKTIPQNLELIREILEDQYETFANMTYQSTDSTLDLVEDSTDTARKGFINKVLKLDELDAMLVEVKAKNKQVKAEIKNKEILIASLEDSVTSIIPNIPDELDEEPVERAIVEASNELDGLNKAFNAVWAKAEVLATKKGELAKYSINKANLETKTLRLSALDYLHTSTEQLDINELARITKLCTEVKLTRKVARESLTGMVAPESVCSRCGQSVNSNDALMQYEQRKASLVETIDECNSKLADLALQLDNSEARVAAWKNYNELRVSVEALKSLTDNFIPPTVEDEEVINNEIVKQREKILAQQLYKQRLEHKLKDIRENNTRSRTYKKINQDAIANNIKISEKIEVAKKELSELYRRIDLLDNWTRILGGNGYRVHKMNRFLQTLNATMDKYSSIITNGKIKCSFYISAEGKIEFSVVDPDKNMPFANYSGGERARIKMACLFSVIEMLEAMGSACYNVLVLDEIFSALDDEGKEGLFEVLSYLRNKGKCIYTISHTPLVNQVVFDSSIEVVKEDGISRIL